MGRLTNPLTTQARMELAHTNLHPIYDLLEYVKGPVIKIQSCRTFTAQENNKIAKRSLSEGPISVV